MIGFKKIDNSLGEPMAVFLVTGGAGFIGSSLADKLLELGHKVVAIDNFDPYYERAIKERNIKKSLSNKNYVFVEGDIRDTDLVKKIIEENKIEKVFHIAARAGVRFSVKDPYSYHDLNVNGTLSMLKACIATKIKRIVFASSSSVYGVQKDLPITEKHPTNPISPYGASKLACEAFCHSFSNVFNIPIISLRYFSVYGPRQRPDMAIRKFTKAIINEEEITIYGDGNQTRDFTFVADVVDATIKAVESNAVGVFNIGSGTRITVNELIKLLETTLNKKAKIKHVDPQKGDVPDTLADVSKAQQILGYKPTVKIKKGIKLFYEWYKNVVNSSTDIQ